MQVSVWMKQWLLISRNIFPHDINQSIVVLDHSLCGALPAMSPRCYEFDWKDSHMCCCHKKQSSYRLIYHCRMSNKCLPSPESLQLVEKKRAKILSSISQELPGNRITPIGLLKSIYRLIFCHGSIDVFVAIIVSFANAFVFAVAEISYAKVVNQF